MKILFLHKNLLLYDFVCLSPGGLPGWWISRQYERLVIHMEKDRRIKLKPGFIQRRIANSDIVIPIGDNIAQFNGLITLNETAAFLFKLITEGSTAGQLVDALTEKYDIDPGLAGKDVADFVSQLEKADMLLPCEEQR